MKLQVEALALFPNKLLFDYLYFCFDTCKKDFLARCRKIIKLDRCFLKGNLKDKIFTTVGRDGNNQMSLMVYAIVKYEHWKTLSWFFKLLLKDFGIHNKREG